MIPAYSLGIALALLGCAAGAGTSGGVAPAVLVAPSTEGVQQGAEGSTRPLSPEPFGEDRYGFVEASSANGRYVALRRFVERDEPQFGHHGEVMGGADLVVVDLVDLSERPFDEVVDVTPDRRFMLLSVGDAPVLLDSVRGRFEALRDADTRSDHNACLGPRQAVFSAAGARLGWVVDQARALRVRDLASGEEWSVPASTPLWRGWPDDEGRGAVLAEVPAGSAEWPQQHTSCACRWCNRFAMSFGFYGWGGPTFALTHVDGAGVRTSSEVTEGERRWHGPDDAGCTLTPEDGERGYAQGPWRRACP
ncbi:MAG: hypothetical protein R3B40_13280 [Polyangiales bacterium]|nr:hypothetical protein [Myxococcales bacterium]